MLFRSRAGHYDEVLWDTITTTHPALAEVPVGGGHGRDMPDMPQLFITKLDSTSEKHHTVTTIDSDDLVVTYSLPIHQHHEEISNTRRMWVWWPWWAYWSARTHIGPQGRMRCISGVSLAIPLL